MAINLNAVHAVSTQGLLLAVVLSLAMGFGIGQYVKTSKRIGSIGGGQKLTS
jgi:adenine/guanine phosphoribosyltransferase-like PRPP-binding protein